MGDWNPLTYSNITAVEILGLIFIIFALLAMIILIFKMIERIKKG